MALSVEGHPMQLLRPLLAPHIVPVRGLRRCDDRSTVWVAGLVTTRQRPMTAKGILFLLLEDETGMVNVVVRKELYEEHREIYRAEPLLALRGVLERRARRLNLVAEEAVPLTEALPDAMKSAANQRVHEALRDWKPPASHNFH